MSEIVPLFYNNPNQRTVQRWIFECLCLFLQIILQQKKKHSLSLFFDSCVVSFLFLKTRQMLVTVKQENLEKVEVQQLVSGGEDSKKVRKRQEPCIAMCMKKTKTVTKPSRTS